MKKVLLLLLRSYQMIISPLLGPCCRFYPTCSEYAYQAVKDFGPWRGSYLAARRLLRCNPWHRGGYDPLPVAAGMKCCSVSAKSEGLDTQENQAKSSKKDLRCGSCGSAIDSDDRSDLPENICCDTCDLDKCRSNLGIKPRNSE